MPTVTPAVTPTLLSAPTVTATGTPPASFTQSPTNTVGDVAQFIGGSILVVGGIGFITLGVAMIGFAVVETAVVTVVPSPIDDLLTLGHRGAAVAGGLVFMLIGVEAISVGYGEMKGALRP
jgi:hypothetical protein